MKSMISLCALVMCMGNAQAEPTPAGSTPTFTTSEGKSFTLYYKDGTPVPPGTKMFITGIGVNFLVNDKGQTIGTVFNTQEEAQRAREAQPDCSGAVFGPGPGGIPAGCPGSSNEASASGTITQVDEDDYNQKVYELAVVLAGSSEIGAKSCKGAGDELPGSLSSWFSAVKSYSTGEKARDKLLNERVAALDEKMQEMTKGDGSSLQVESIQLQIDTVAASIESVNGASGRIPLREKLILAALKSVETNGKENTASMDAYFNLRDKALQASVDVAKAACERKKKVKKCEVDEEGNEKCTEREEKDPVPGCDVVQAQVPVIKSGALQSYGEVYLSKMQSTPLNDRMQMFADDMKNTMAALPRSDDANYDWSTPMETALEALEKARKKSGAKCPDGEAALANIETVENSKDPKAVAKSKEELSSATTDSGKISKASEAFLSSIGVESNPAAAKGFVEAWKAADAVIGQAANRPEYFDYITEKANAILEMDRVKLQNLLISKAKLEKYLSSLKKVLASTSKASSSSSASGNKSADSGSKIVLASESSQTASGATAIKNVAVNSNDTATVAATQNTLSLSGVSDSSTGGKLSSTQSLSNFSSGKMSSGDGLSLSGSSMAVAKKTLANISQAQKKLTAGTNSILPLPTPTPGTGGSSSKEKTKIAGGKNEVSYTSSSNSFGSVMENSFTKFKNTEGAPEVYKSASIGGSRYSSSNEGTGTYIGGGSRGTVRTYEETVGYSKAPAKVSTQSSAKAEAKTAAVSTTSKDAEPYQLQEASNDARILSQSITAKKFRKKNEYDAKDSDSLFERVTKAYIRSYEKVEEKANP